MHIQFVTLEKDSLKSYNKTIKLNFIINYIMKLYNKLYNKNFLIFQVNYKNTLIFCCTGALQIQHLRHF